MRAIRYAHGLSFVVRAASLDGTIGRLAELDTVFETERLIQLHLQEDRVTARVYTPLRPPRQTVLLVSGLHPAGIDEPRLVAFARELARTRVTVVTPDIPELRRLEIAPALTDRVEQAAVSVATDESLAPTGRIGLMGISFSGGLAVVAAGRPRLRDHLSYVFALGGHDDLPRVLRYLSTGAEPAPPGTTARSRDGLGIRRLLPHLESLPDVPALSASRSPAPTVPVFLLHGSSDTVIPPAESEYLANRLRGRVRVRLLVTDLVSHAEAHERARATDLLRLAGFWGDMLAR
jgi:dienelactone hydrolase